jgi:hypothetical protein
MTRASLETCAGRFSDISFRAVREKIAMMHDSKIIAIINRMKTF